MMKIGWLSLNLSKVDREECLFFFFFFFEKRPPVCIFYSSREEAFKEFHFIFGLLIKEKIGIYANGFSIWIFSEKMKRYRKRIFLYTANPQIKYMSMA